MFAALNWFSPLGPKFYVGIDVAYKDATINDVRMVVDKVKSYTNVFVIGSVELTYNLTALDETCDYIYKAGLKIIVLLTNVTNYSFNTVAWTAKAEQKYGDSFLALYRYDEPGGDQLENPVLRFVQNATSYAEAATLFVQRLGAQIDLYVGSVDRIVSADYGLYWWDYKSNYSAVFAEFVGNQSRERHIALCRGAASANRKDWGVSITWKYDNAPYMESSQELYSDLKLAYSAGAKYMIVFDYPKIGPYGILTEEHFEVLKQFWEYTRENPEGFGAVKADVAYVLPKDYGSGLRSADDKIWGIFPADDLSAKVWNDIDTLIGRYGAKFDILFDDEALGNVTNRYAEVFFWNETIT